jgi:hypothetical protein
MLVFTTTIGTWVYSGRANRSRELFAELLTATEAICA